MEGGRHTFGSAVRRRSNANRPPAPFTASTAQRPGEIVQADTTPLDVMAVFDDGVLGRPELTITLDVATRTIGAAVLRPAGTKAVDAAVLLARMLVPEPMRPGWDPALSMARSVLPYQRLVTVDQRLAAAAASKKSLARNPASVTCSGCGFRQRASASAASLGSGPPRRLATPPPHPGGCNDDSAG